MNKTYCDFCVFGPTCVAYEIDPEGCSLFFVPSSNANAYELFVASQEVSEDGN